MQARLLSREIKGFGVPTPLTEAEGNIAGRVIASGRRAPRGRRPGACTRVSRRENREVPRSPVLVDVALVGMAVAGRLVAGREGNAEAVRPR